MVRRIAETSSSFFVSARCSSIVSIFFRLGLSIACADFRSFHAEFNASCVRRNSSFRYVTLVDCSFSLIRRLRCLVVFFRSRTFVPVCDRISEKLYFVWLWQHCLSAESIYCVSSLSMFWKVCLSLLEMFCVCLHFSCSVTNRWCRLLLVTHFIRCVKYRARLCGAVERRRLLLNCAGSSMFLPNIFVSSMSRYSPKWSETRDSSMVGIKSM